MKRILSLLILVSCTAFAATTIAPVKKTPVKGQTKFICARDVMGDTELISVYPNKAECNKYCLGISEVCQETSINTPVDTTEVD